MPTRVTKSARWLWYLPTILLIGVACHQIWLAHTANLSAWHGGGFGMFSTTDAAGRRHLHAFAIRPGIRRELNIPPALEERALRAAALPTDLRLGELGRDLAEVPTPDEGALEAIEIQVWTTRFDPSNLEPSGFLLRSFEVRFGER
jgi:hypothetical protein